MVLRFMGADIPSAEGSFALMEWHGRLAGRIARRAERGPIWIKLFEELVGYQQFSSLADVFTEFGRRIDRVTPNIVGKDQGWAVSEADRDSEVIIRMLFIPAAKIGTDHSSEIEKRSGVVSDDEKVVGLHFDQVDPVLGLDRSG